MTVASIDIGTNTCLLLIASVMDDGTIVPIIDEQRLPRLGQGVDAHRRLATGSMQRVLGVLHEYGAIIAQHHPTSIAVAATSAVRDAANRTDFLTLVRSGTGLRVEVLSGDEEALWTYRGALSGVGTGGPVAVVDIGGGSTELSFGNGLQLDWSVSIDVGSVRITERFFHHDPPHDEELQHARTFLEDQFRPYSLPAAATVIGVAGTAVGLALLDMGAREFDPQKVSGHLLTHETITLLLHQLSRTPSGEIRRLSPFLIGREDIITAGALILDAILSWFTLPSIIVSERGLRHGLAIRAWAGGKGPPM